MKNTFLSLIILFLTFSSLAQEKKEYSVGCIAFYNIENLFDTIPGSNDREFSPTSEKKWNTTKYNKKLDDIASVIKDIGADVTGSAPAILGLSEIENISVLHDLVKAKDIAKYNYQVIHFDGPDRRGVDCALLYRSEYFKPTSTKMYSVKFDDKPTWTTRDQLLVSGMYNGEEIHVIVLHWPSRYGGEKRSAPARASAADVTRHIVDSLLALDNNAKIICMGDLNDDPDDKSVAINLNTASNKESAVLPKLYNPMYPLFEKGIGSLAYNDNWNLFDQIVISPGLINQDASTYQFYMAGVYNKSYLTQKEGRYKGYPFRTYVGKTYKGGYSDHFPVYIYIVKEKI